ncbi:MAG: radical SAM protein [Treponemataceae bacterium]
MKLLLTTLNAKFIHTSLAIRYLHAVATEIVDCEIKEFTINHTVNTIVNSILLNEFDLIGFSTYIWNAEETFKVASTIKKARPDVKIIFGGPEISYDVKEQMQKYPFIDFVISGEGEEVLKEFLYKIKNGVEVFNIQGLSQRLGEKLFINDQLRIVENLNIIPSPYKIEFEKLGRENFSRAYKNKIVYYEGARGCPFNCKFCLSSTIKKLRYFSLDRIKNDLSILINAGVSQVKFIDRTFNANKNHFCEIIKYIIENDNGNINFHFELVASLISDEMLELFSKVRKGLFQFEIGVQSTNEKTLIEVGRNSDFDKIKKTCKEIVSFGNIHQHLDLIAGLPFETYKRFGKSFDDLYEVGVEKIQLGFLKLLRGSALRENSEKYGYKYTDYPPYEIIANDYLSYKEIIKLKEIEDLSEKYLNENNFKYTLDYVIKKIGSAFEFFEKLSEYWEGKNYFELAHSKASLYVMLYDFLQIDFSNDKYITSLLRLDFFLNNINTKTPNVLMRDDKFSYHTMHKIISELLETSALKTKSSVKEIMKSASIKTFNPKLKEKDFSGEYLLFYYDRKKGKKFVFDVSEKMENERVIT